MWKEHLKNLLRKSPKVTNKPMKIIDNQLDIKLGQFSQKPNIVLTKIKNRKVTSLDEMPSEVWNTRKFDDSDTVMPYITTTQ